MNLTKIQLQSMPLVERQKMVMELERIPANDKDYARAKAIIDTIADSKGYKPPKAVTVRALEDVILEERQYKKGETAQIKPWQWHSWSQYFELVLTDEQQKTREAALKEFQDELGKARQEPNGELRENKLIALREKHGPKLAATLACLLFFLGMLLAPIASAQNQYTLMYVLGPSNQVYNGVAQIPLTTNFIAASTQTNYNVAIQTIITNFQPNIILSNGIVVVTTNTVTTTNSFVPGLLNLTHFDSTTLELSYGLLGAGTQPVTVFGSFSNDGVNFITNGVILAVTAAGTSYVAGGTNLNQNVLGAWGYVRIDCVTNGNANGATNIVLTASKKPIRAGP